MRAYSIEQVLERVPYGREKLYQEIRSGRLIARKSGRRTLILAKDLNSYLDTLRAWTPRDGQYYGPKRKTPEAAV
jgi:hypothetical protein